MTKNRHKDYFLNLAQIFASFAVKKNLIQKCILLRLLFIFLPSSSFCQETNISEVIINIAEELAADDSDPEAVLIYIERLTELSENLVRINSSPEEEISRLFFLSDFQVKALADYVHSSGQILSYQELSNIPGFDEESAAMIIPFTTLSTGTPDNKDQYNRSNNFMANLSVKPGEKDTAALGSQWKILTRYRFTSGPISGGFTAEKDPGELLIGGKPPLPDYYSGFITYTGKGMLRRVIAGDYSIRFGQGTNINTSIRTGLSITNPGYLSTRDEIKPYTSCDENKYFRGVAAEFNVGKLAIFTFFSHNRIDATLESTEGLSNDHIKTFYTSGIHNKSSQLVKKDAVEEIAHGINLTYRFPGSSIGLTWSGGNFSLPLSDNSTNPEYVFNHKGSINNVFSLNYNTQIKRVLLSGEISADEFKKYALVLGSSLRPSDRLSITFLYRSYDAGYFAFHGNGPGSSSSTSNEKGLLGNFTFEAARNLFLSGGIDIRKFPWLRYSCSAPSSGIRKEIRIRYVPTEKLSFDALYNYRLSMADKSGGVFIAQQEELTARSFKGAVRYFPSPNLNLSVRMDYKTVNPSGSTGMLLLQDINYHFNRVPVTIWFRYCLFHTDDWNSRIYTYENDLLYSYSIPALTGEGSRSYIMVKWEPGKNSEIRIRYGLTSLAKGNNLYEETDEFRFQLRIWF